MLHSAGIQRASLEVEFVSMVSSKLLAAQHELPWSSSLPGTGGAIGGQSQWGPLLEGLTAMCQQVCFSCKQSGPDQRLLVLMCKVLRRGSEKWLKIHNNSFQSAMGWATPLRQKGHTQAERSFFL